jgi:hypothetical protein
MKLNLSSKESKPTNNYVDPYYFQKKPWDKPGSLRSSDLTIQMCRSIPRLPRMTMISLRVDFDFFANRTKRIIFINFFQHKSSLRL